VALKSRKLVFVIGIVFIAVIANVPVFASAVSSLPVNQIVFPSLAYCFSGFISPAIAVPIENTLNISITAIVFAVLHNSIGQPLQVSTGTVTLAGGGNATVYVPNTLPIGNYSTDIFVWSVNDSSLSVEESYLFSC
jgi:hypothetical protein